MFPVRPPDYSQVDTFQRSTRPQRGLEAPARSGLRPERSVSRSATLSYGIPNQILPILL